MPLKGSTKKTTAPVRNDQGWCNCIDIDGKVTITNEHFIEYAPLKGGCHTMFSVGQCKKCGGVTGFPTENLVDFLRRGEDEYVNKLRDKFNLKKEFTDECS